MSLVLTCASNDLVYVGDHVVKVGPILTADTFFISFDADQSRLITSEAWVTVHPGVKVRSTLPRTSSVAKVRVQFDAPSFHIYRNQQEMPHDET